jgi:pyruvate dehydrogenase E2 component (dihydrolipoamide acetyltransferase)
VVTPGTTVPTGTVLAVIREDVPAAAGPAAPAVPAPARARITPLARKLAVQLGVDVTTLAGTGPGEAVTREDVERAAAAARPAAPARAGVDLAAMRRTIGVAMARAKREIPHYYLAHTIDLQRAAGWLAEENTRRPVTERLLPGVLFVKAVALALREVPELNAVWREGRAEPAAAIHVGVAITLRGGGLVAPALRDADGRPLGELMAAFRDLVQRARTGGLRSSELSDPTITVTSLGDQGVETVFGIVYPPQTAIVGFGRIVRRPWVVDGGAIGPRTVVTATLSADHRVTDGHRGGLFLAAVDRLLQAPERL